MLPSADTTFNYNSLTPEKAASARAAAERIRGRIYATAIETGADLIEQKESLGHGNFLPWIRAEFGYSEDTAQGLMRISREFKGNTEQVRHLTYKALLALAAPSTPEPVRTEVLERASTGEKVSAKEIETLKRKLKKAEDAASIATDSASLMEGRAQTIERELESANLSRLYAEQDAQRRAQEADDLREEIDRLKEPGVITIDPVKQFNEVFVSQPEAQTPWTEDDTQLRVLQSVWMDTSVKAQEGFLEWLESRGIKVAA